MELLQPVRNLDFPEETPLLLPQAKNWQASNLLSLRWKKDHVLQFERLEVNFNGVVVQHLRWWQESVSCDNGKNS